MGALPLDALPYLPLSKKPFCTLWKQGDAHILKLYMQALFQQQLPPSPDHTCMLSRHWVPLQHPLPTVWWNLPKELYTNNPAIGLVAVSSRKLESF